MPSEPPIPRQSSPESIRGMFGAITPTYDRLNLLFSGSMDRRWRARAARETLRGLDPCRRILDLATGTGDLAAAILREKKGSEYPPEGGTPKLIFGADFTREMLREAARKYGREMIWLEADGLHLPLPDGAFDAVTIAFGLRNMADRTAALREMARVVRPGGRVAVLEFSQPKNPIIRVLYDFYSFAVLPRVGRWISGSDAYLYLARSIRAFWTAKELSAQMQAAGLSEVRAIPLTMGVVYLHVGIKGK